jgi:hypothetical protein
MARSLADGRGLEYRGSPTAYRMPLYPMALAAALKAVVASLT